MVKGACNIQQSAAVFGTEVRLHKSVAILSQLLLAGQQIDGKNQRQHKVDHLIGHGSNHRYSSTNGTSQAFVKVSGNALPIQCLQLEQQFIQIDPIQAESFFQQRQSLLQQTGHFTEKQLYRCPQFGQDHPYQQNQDEQYTGQRQQDTDRALELFGLLALPTAEQIFFVKIQQQINDIRNGTTQQQWPCGAEQQGQKSRDLRPVGDA